MADNTGLNSGTGGNTIRDVDKGGIHTQVVVIDIGGAGAESLLSGSLPVTGTFFQATQPVSGSVTISNFPASQAVTGTFFQATQPVSGTFFQATQPVSAAALPLPAGAATETGHLAAIDTSTAKIPSQGQALAAASMPVVLTAIQQTALTPPAAITGFALEAGHLAAIDTSTAKIPSQGQALAAASMPVVLTAAQITTLTPLSSVSISASALPANAAIETGGNLAALVAKDFATQTTLAATAAVIGAVADASVRVDDDGTLSARLRGISEQLDELIGIHKENQLMYLQMLFALQAISSNNPYEVQ